MSERYSAKIIDSSRELSVQERIKFKDIGDAIKLDDICEESAIIIPVEDYVVISVHNEKSDTKDYEKYLILSSDGEKYVTGSQSFWSNFKDFVEELSTEGITKFNLKVYKRDSANYKGKKFLTCSLA